MRDQIEMTAIQFIEARWTILNPRDQMSSNREGGKRMRSWCPSLERCTQIFGMPISWATLTDYPARIVLMRETSFFYLTHVVLTLEGALGMKLKHDNFQAGLPWSRKDAQEGGEILSLDH